VRDSNYRRGYDVHTPDRIEMLRVLRLVGRSIWRHWRFAATELIHRSVARAIGAAARRCGTRHRRRHAHAERKKQGNKDYGEEAHDDYLLSLTVTVMAIRFVFSTYGDANASAVTGIKQQRFCYFSLINNCMVLANEAQRRERV
jgi:hypothetical protein